MPDGNEVVPTGKEQVMTDIEIMFPAKDEATGVTKAEVYVTRESQAMKENQRVTWEITSFNPDIERVRIKFDDPSLDFFPDETSSIPLPPSPEIEEPLPKPYSGSHDQLIRRREIYGRAPIVQNMNDGECRLCKYTVFGLDANGGELVKHDPDIVIARP
jgi:hypothetical protein